MSVLSGEQIANHIFLSDGMNANDRIYITPLLEGIKQITKDGVDLRLGSYFVTSKRTEYAAFDISSNHDVRKFQEKIFIPLGQSIFLLPKCFALGVSLEYIKLPKCLSCEVVTRSTWGRLGLIIATAVWVHPGFKGCLTLELFNTGDIPIALFPGMKVGTLVFHKIEGQVSVDQEQSEKYEGFVLPEYSKTDTDLTELKKLQSIVNNFYPPKK